MKLASPRQHDITLAPHIINRTNEHLQPCTILINDIQKCSMTKKPVPLPPVRSSSSQLTSRADIDRRKRSNLAPSVITGSPNCSEPRNTPLIRVNSDIVETSSNHLSPNYSRNPRAPNKHLKSNGLDMKPRDTIVSFAEDPVPPSHCCCGTIRVESGCKIVAILSLIGMTTNAILYFFGLSRLGLSTYLELFIIVFDFIAVVCLFMGVSNKRSSMLKPYLLFMALWTVALSLLFLSCLWNVLRNREFPRNLLHNVYSLKGDPDPHRMRHVRHGDDGVHFVVTTVLMVALGLVIFIDGVFLHVVYRGFQFFAYKEDKEREEEEGKSPRANGSSPIAT
ncbi:unnamed protein product [Auanema sp. JU1783]|nr:unnamed protein product [Auanema sp. JU1783]